MRWRWRSLPEAQLSNQGTRGLNRTVLQLLAVSTSPVLHPNFLVSLGKLSSKVQPPIAELGKLKISHPGTAMTRSNLTTTNNSPEIQTTQPIESRFSPWLTNIIYPIGQHLLLPGFFREIEVIGQEYLPQSGAVILAPTHRARWDSLLIPYAAGPYVTGRSLRFMVSIDEMNGLQGWFVRRLGGFPIDTTKPGIGTIRHSVELLHQGEMLTIYPEGNIFRDGTLHPLKKGLARIAIQSVSLKPNLDLQVIPISLHYEHPIPKFRDRVSISIGEPLQVQNYQHLSSKKGAEELHLDLTQSLTKLIEN
jgi:1-acyl-sn-glycerol-3-phosphate acyltransferase